MLCERLLRLRVVERLNFCLFVFYGNVKRVKNKQHIGDVISFRVLLQATLYYHNKNNPFFASIRFDLNRLLNQKNVQLIIQTIFVSNKNLRRSFNVNCMNRGRKMRSVWKRTKRNAVKKEAKNNIVKWMHITGSLKTFTRHWHHGVRIALLERARHPVPIIHLCDETDSSKYFYQIGFVCAPRTAMLRGVFCLIWSLNVYFRKRLVLFTLRFISVENSINTRCSHTNKHKTTAVIKPLNLYRNLTFGRMIS